MAGIKYPARFDHHQLGFAVGGRPVFDATRHDDELAGIEGLDAIAELDPEPAFPDEEQFVGVGVAFVVYLILRTLAPNS